MRPTPHEARHALLHPIWLGSLALLVLNDHLLKGADVLPGWLTGKLSDFVGMLVAPAVLACALRLRSERGWAGAHLAIGVVFAGINVFPAAARAFEALTALTPLPWAITVDPTDLIALPMLWVSYTVLGAAMRRPTKSPARRALQGAALGAGALACMGTSPPCDGDCVGTPLPPAEQASLTLGNTTDQQRLVRLRPLSSTIVADCETLLEDPTAALHRDMFDPAEAWLLEPGRALPLRPRRNTGCEAFLVDAQGLPMTLIAWDANQFPEQVLPTAVEQAAQQPDRMIMMRQADSELELDAHVAVFDAPAEEPFDPEPACRVPDETVGIAWSDLPLGTQTLVSITSSPDGCHDVQLDSSSFYVCLPLETLPFEIGELIDVGTFGVSSDIDGELGSAGGIEIYGESHIVRAAAGSAVLSPSEDGSYQVEVETQPGCSPHHDACSNYVTPLEVTYVGSGLVSLRAGESTQREEDGSTLYLVRAQHMPIRNTACSDFDASQSAFYFESVLVTPLPQL